MKTKLDELMTLADDYANHFRGWQPIDNKYREVLRETLVAALGQPQDMLTSNGDPRGLVPTSSLNPMGEPIYQLRSMVGNWIDQSQDSYEYNTRQGWTTRIVYTAPPVQKPDANSEYEADVWHEGSQSFYRANLLYKLTPEEVDAAPPAQTLCYCKDRPSQDCPGEWEPGCDLGNNDAHAVVVHTPPRLKDTAVKACIKAVEDAFAWTGGHGEPPKPGPGAIANIIRSHFHVAQTPPPRLTYGQIVDAIAITGYSAEAEKYHKVARAIETAVRKQFGYE